MVKEKDFKKKERKKKKIREGLKRHKENYRCVQVKNLKTRCELLNNLLSFLPS